MLYFNFYPQKCPYFVVAPSLLPVVACLARLSSSSSSSFAQQPIRTKLNVNYLLCHLSRFFFWSICEAISSLSSSWILQLWVWKLFSLNITKKCVCVCVCIAKMCDEEKRNEHIVMWVAEKIIQHKCVWK